MDTRVAYLVLVAAVALERGFELVLSTRNARRLRARGGVEIGERHYPFMVVLHTGVLVACPLEVGFLRRPWIAPLGTAMLVLLAGTMALRYWAVASLGERWNTRVIGVPGETPVRRGPYRWLRHPNYVAVAVEIVALPMVHTAWVVATVGTVLNAAVLRARIAVENEALRRWSAPAGGGSP